MVENRINIARNMAEGGCAHQYVNCSQLKGFKDAGIGHHVGPCPSHPRINSSVVFRYFDLSKTKKDAFVIPAMMVKRGDAWFAGEIDALDLPSCGWQGVFPDASEVPQPE